MTTLPYSSEEHEAFNIADELGDDIPVDREKIRKLLNALAFESHRARVHLDKALWGLNEKSKAKRESIAAIIKMSRD